jgi:hypothetical protein
MLDGKAWPFRLTISSLLLGVMIGGSIGRPFGLAYT